MKTLLVLLVLALAPLPALADAPQIDPAGTITITCGITGGASVAVPGGKYVLLVRVETSALCYAATCATGGAPLGPGDHGTILVRGSKTASCRADGGAGSIALVPDRSK